MTYNPFDKSPFDILTVEDLEKLIENSVAEGYYVEYKSQFVKNEKIGWSISSFANTYGGWYIVGVKTNEHNIATEISGFKLSDYPDPIDKIREIVKSNIDPVPLFYSQVIRLDEEKAVLVVFVPDNQDKPFICKNGRVYRRVADSSDPILENNRYALDKLYEEGEKIKNEFKEFCQDERVHDDRNGWVKIFISPYPLGIEDNNFWINFNTSETIEEILNLSKKALTIPGGNGATGNLPLNCGQTTFNSLIFRQTKVFSYNSVELELFLNFQAKIFIPIRIIEPWQSKIASNLSQPVNSVFKELISTGDISFEKDFNTLLKFVDLEHLYFSIITLMSLYEHIASNKSSIKQVTVAIKLENVQKHVPFFDSVKWSEYVESSGLPVNHRQSSAIFGRKGTGMIMDIDNEVGLWFSTCRFIGNEFGLPSELTSDIIYEAAHRKSMTDN